MSEAYEVPLEEHLDLTTPGSPTSSSSPHSRSGVAKRLTNLVMRPKQRRQDGDVSISSDHATAQSVEGLQSIQSTHSSFTLESHDTIKMSNRSEAQSSEANTKKGNRWVKIKRMIGVKPTPEEVSPEAPKAKKGSKDDTWKAKNSGTEENRRRAKSSDSTKFARVRSTPSPKEQYKIDQSIRGRLDGLDVLSLGPVPLVSLPPDPDSSTDAAPWDDLPLHAFSGKVAHQSPSNLVRNMLWMSGGRCPPEMILEGFLPGGDDRWSVRIEQTSDATTASIIPSLAFVDSDEYETSEDGSPNMAPHKLWDTLWGSEPPPANLTNLDKVVADEETDDDRLMTLVAENSIPIDLDEDTFIVSTREHLQAIHGIAHVPLSTGRFAAALEIFYKLLKGIGMLEDKELRSLLGGSTWHNIGVIKLWQGRYEDALSSLERAIKERADYLPINHPDTAVSMVRKSMALFALERFDEAEKALMLAQLKTQPDDVARAKILNNLGVVHYHKRDFAAANSDFTAALEIQRHWLEGPVRRESIVYDAAVTLGNMGRLYIERGEYDLAYYVYEEALLLQTTIYRKDHDAVLASLTSLALVKAKTTHNKKAIQILSGCLRSQEAKFGPDSSETMDTTGLMGYLYARQGNFDDAHKYLTKVKHWQKTNLASGHSARLMTKKAIDRLEAAMPKKTSSWI